jgi:predicted nucleic acid-binding protein
VTRDPGDDYLVALANAAQAELVSGDPDLCQTGFALTPRRFLESLQGQTEVPLITSTDVEEARSSSPKTT